MNKDDDSIIESLKSSSDGYLGYVAKATSSELDASNSAFDDFHQKCLVYDNLIIAQLDVRVEGHEVVVYIREMRKTPSELREMLKSDGFELMTQPQYMSIIADHRESTRLASHGLVRALNSVFLNGSLPYVRGATQQGDRNEESCVFHLSRTHTFLGRYVSNDPMTHQALFEACVVRIVQPTQTNSLGRELPFLGYFQLMNSQSDVWTDGNHQFDPATLARHLLEIAKSCSPTGD